MRRLTFAVLLIALTAHELRSDPGDLIAHLPLGEVSPQDIARDVDGTFWISIFLSGNIHHVSADLQEEIDVLPSPFPAGSFVTGLAFNTIEETIFVVDSVSSTILEILRDGSLTGRSIVPQLEPVVNPNGFPTLRGMAFDATGDGGRGSLYFVETVGTLIYEISLEGDTLRTFTHPDDPDGFPGEGADARAAAIDLIFDAGELAGFYVTGHRGRDQRILKLDADGSYTGISIPLIAASGTVSGMVRERISDPTGEGEIDTFICVVESNARMALLEWGEPEFLEVFDVTCEESGSDLDVSWTSRQIYDAIDIVDGCEVLATLPGAATSWSHRFPNDGSHELAIRTHRGTETRTTATCLVIIGPGQVLRRTDFEADFAIDLTSDGEFIFVSDAFEHLIQVLTLNGDPNGTIPLFEDIAGEDEAITGLARGAETETLYVYNNSRHRVFVIDYGGEAIAEFSVQLPELSEPDPDKPKEIERGTVIGMSFDPRGDEGRGSLWLVEVVDDQIHEIDLEGSLLHSVPHPFRGRVDIPRDAPYGVYSGGITVLRNSDSTRLLLSGGQLRDRSQRWIFEMDPLSGRIAEGSLFSTAAIRRDAKAGSFTLLHLPDDRLLVHSYTSRKDSLFEVEWRRERLAEPQFLECRQRSLANEIELRFVPGASYETIEIFCDCELVAEIAGDVELWIDWNATPGVHTYGVRGVSGEQFSEQASCELRVGVGATLESSFSWPARSPQQITRDPVDGSFYVSVNWPGDERLLHHYDAGLRLIGVRDSALSEPWEIATLAVRAPSASDRQLYCIAWKQPVPLGSAGSEEFFLISETLDGEFLDEQPIDPPRPTNGFVTFPTALVWRKASDTFYYLERNSRTFVEMRPDGSTLRTFPHPAPPFQNFVFNLGMTLAEKRDTLLITGSELEDLDVGQVMEMTLGGELTGYKFSLRELPGKVRGLAAAGDTLVAAMPSSLSQLVRLKAFPELPEPFVRGDANLDGIVNLSDAIATLNYMFQSGEAPRCFDGADSDDSGRLDINDPVVTLRHLFLGALPLPWPFPDPGHDPTPDGLVCHE